MKTYTIEGIQSGEYDKGLKDYKVQAALHFFSKTSNPIPLELDEEELISKTPEEGFTNVMEPKVLKIIGESYSDKGCVGLDYKNDVDYSETVDGLFADGLQAASESKNHLLGILLCERDGKIEDTPCDKFDYVESDYTPSTEPSDEELAILAEREEAAEREAESPSDSVETSNAKPFQVCGALGKLVQTESYGELQCKAIWTNRVKALIWMRTGRS